MSAGYYGCNHEIEIVNGNSVRLVNDDDPHYKQTFVEASALDQFIGSLIVARVAVFGVADWMHKEE